MPAPDLWVIGSGGLLGSAVVRAAQARRLAVIQPGLTWSQPLDSADLIARALRTFRNAERPARIAWCAGVGVTSSPAETFTNEHEMFTMLAEAMSTQLGPNLVTKSTLFVASSFGAAYAGSGPGPHDERSEVQVNSEYGKAKLRLEAKAVELAAATGCRAVLGRITNLYGPGQNLAKPQGLVSVLTRGALLHEPVRIYVPLDTVRDYLFVDDAGRLVLRCLDRAATMPAGSSQVKVLGSMQRTTVASLIAQVSRIGHGRLLVSQGSSPQSALQSRDLSAASHVWTDLDRYRVTSADGLFKTWLSLNRRFLSAAL